MKRALSTVRESTPFAFPPHVLVVSDEGHAGEALMLADALDQIGAEAEIRFGDETGFESGHPDAVIVTDSGGYRVARHHPVLENFCPHFGR